MIALIGIEGRPQSLFGHRVCQQAFRAILGLGSARWRRLRKCAIAGTSAPIDGRTLPRKGAHLNHKKAEHRQLIVEYLQEIYESLSEPMPETKGKIAGERKLAFRRNRGKRPREAAQVHRLRKASATATESAESEPMRMLPPGTFTEYLVMLRSRHPDKKISLKLFNSDIW